MENRPAVAADRLVMNIDIYSGFPVVAIIPVGRMIMVLTVITVLYASGGEDTYHADECQ